MVSSQFWGEMNEVMIENGGEVTYKYFTNKVSMNELHYGKKTLFLSIAAQSQQKK